MSAIFAAEYNDGPAGKALHFHDCHQLLYIAEGAVEVTVAGETRAAGAGDLLLFSRLEHHAVTVTAAPYRRYTLELTPGGQSGLDALVSRSARLGGKVALPGAEPLLAALVREFAQEAPMGEELRELLTRQLEISLYRQLPVRQETVEERLIFSVQRELEVRYAEELTLGELAEGCHLSPSRLSHLFRQVTGRAVMDYRNACRLAAAKKLLVQTDLPVGEIVDRCGYTDASNFSRSFRSVTGLTPTQFRKRCK